MKDLGLVALGFACSAITGLALSWIMMLHDDPDTSDDESDNTTNVDIITDEEGMDEETLADDLDTIPEEESDH